MFRAYWADSRQSQLKVETCLPRSETQFSGMYAVVACSEVWLVSSSLWKYVITSTNHRASLPDSFCTDQWEKELICVRPIREQRSSRQRYTEHWETAQSWLDQSETSIRVMWSVWTNQRQYMWCKEVPSHDNAQALRTEACLASGKYPGRHN